MENSGTATESPTQPEIRKTVRQITTGKAAEADNISPETRKSDNQTKVKLSHPLFADIWDKEDIPDNWQEGLITKAAKERQQFKML